MSATYQYNTEARLVPNVPSLQPPAEMLREIKFTRGKEHLGTLTFIPWQDGCVIRMKGKISLDPILTIAYRQRPMVIPSDGYQYSMVLKVTRRDFGDWVNVIVEADEQCGQESRSDILSGHKGGSRAWHVR